MLLSRVLFAFCSALFISSDAIGQTFYTETFDGTVCAASSNCDPSLVGWTVTSVGAEGASANKWFVSCQENGNAAGACGTGCGSDQSLHLGSITAAFICPSGDCGASYNASGAANVTDKRAESPVINCTGKTGITLAFNYIGKGQSCTTDFTDLQYSSNGGTTWNNLQACMVSATCGGGQGLWTAFSIVLPAACDNNPNVKLGFRWKNNGDGSGSDPSFAVDDITLSVVTAVNTITTGLITGSPFCACSSVSIPFTSTGTFTAGNIYTAELSDASGSFTAPVSIGTLASTANSGTITATIPCSAVTGSNYRIRVISSAPATTGTDNGVNITINAPAVATFSYTGTPYCSNGTDPSPTFSGGGVAGTFSSTTGLVFVSASTGQVDLSASTAGTYTITNTIPASGGCAAVTATSSITINPEQSSAFSYSGSTFCQTGTDPMPTITGVSGGAFSASPGGLVFTSTTTGEIDLSASALNTYTITYTSPSPCSSTSTTSVTITNAPVATFSYTASPYCQNATDPSPVFSGGGVAGSFSSTAGLVFVNASTGEVDLSASTAGTYTVTNTIPASGGCPAVTATASITINAVQSSAFSYSGSTFCQSGTDPIPTITGVSGGTFSASPGGLVFTSTTTGEIDLSASALNSYIITYTSPAPCSSSSIANVTITNAPVATFSYPPGQFCAEDPDPFPTYSGGGSAGTFSSSAGLVFISTSTGQIDLSASTPGAYTVTNTIPASGSCPAATATSGITIIPNDDPSFSYSGLTFCQSGTVTPVISGTPGGAFTSTGLVFISTTTGEIDLASSGVGSYFVTYSTTGLCARDSTITITITPTPDATFMYAGSPYCKNDPNPSPVFTGTATAGTFSSTAGLSFVSTSTGEVNLAGSTAGTYTITNTIAASGNCPAESATFDITINDAPTTAVTSATICNGQSATLNASGANSYSWNTGATSSSITVSPTTSTSYTVTGSTNGCTETAVANVVVNNCNEPVADFTGDPTIMCEAGCVNFTDLSTNSPTSWTWSFPGASPASSTAQNPTDICYSADGSYDVTLIVSNASGADTLTKPGFINIGSPVQVEITGNLLITSCESTTLTAVPSDGTYEWGPSGTLSSSSGASVTATPPETQEYYVTYTSPDGCTDSDTTTVVVEDINTYFLPTGFTPNNDGINDEIHLHGRGIDYFTLRIFDRIGEKVFQTSDLEKGWNGKYLGLPMNDGVFVYTLDITFCNGEKVKQHGDITLVK
ncbi:MAG: hypothetical protein K0Q95_637 [Bacteroidota bacterium]|nr:hypothetical protein [Bacteroidota bacterium]